MCKLSTSMCACTYKRTSKIINNCGLLLDVLKISDFGLSTVFKHQGQERKLNRRCGTPPYIAPEVQHYMYVH